MKKNSSFLFLSNNLKKWFQFPSYIPIKLFHFISKVFLQNIQRISWKLNSKIINSKTKNYNAAKSTLNIKMSPCSNSWIALNFNSYRAMFLSCYLQWFMIYLNGFNRSKNNFLKLNYYNILVILLLNHKRKQVYQLLIIPFQYPLLR